jgi:outer membrane lipoprotein-sorting protein
LDLAIIPACPLMEKAKNAIANAQPFTVKFKNQVFNDKIKELEETGNIVFLDQNHIKWTYQQPDLKIWLLKDKEYRFYHEDNEQLIIGRANQINNHWIWNLFSANLDSYHLECQEKKQWIHIKKESESLDIKIFFNQNFLVNKVIQLDPTGLEVVYLFEDYQQKATIPANTFELKVPENTDTIFYDEEK